MKKRTNWGDLLVRAAEATGSSTDGQAVVIRRQISEAVSQVDHGGRRRGGRRVLRLPLLEATQVRALPEGHRLGQRPHREQGWSTSPPRSRCGSRRSSSTKAIWSSRARCWCSWTPSRWRPSSPRRRRASRPRRSSWRSPRRRSSSSRARSSWRRSRRSARRSWWREGAGSQRELDVRTTKLKTTHGRRSPRRRRSCRRRTQQVEVARGERGDDPDAHRRRDAASRRCIGRVLYRLAEPGEVLAAGRQGADAGEPRRRLHGDLPARPSEAAAREDRRRGAHHRRLRARPRRSPATSASSRRKRSSRPSRSRRKSEREKLMFRVKIQVPQGAGAATTSSASRPACAASAT